MDQDKALAWKRVSADVCPNCGTHDDEWRDGKKLLWPPPYEVVTHRCAGCKEIAMKRHEVQQQADSDPDGLYMHLRRADPLDYLEVDG